MNALDTLWSPVLWGQAQTDALRRVEAVIEAARALIEDIDPYEPTPEWDALKTALAALDEGGET